MCGGRASTIGFRAAIACKSDSFRCNLMKLPMSQGCALLILSSKGQRSRSWNICDWNGLRNITDYIICNLPMIMKLHTLAPYESRMNAIAFEVKRFGDHLFFPIGPKNTNLVEVVEILLPLKFRWILFSSFRGEVEKCLSQSDTRATILFFRSARKNNKRP